MPPNKALAIVIIALVCQACAGRPPMSSAPEAFRQFSADSQHRRQLYELTLYLSRHRVDRVVPLDQLLQQGTSWKTNRQPRYAIPEQSLWPNMVQTLKLIDRFIIPAVGPIDVVSGFRTPTYNNLAGGAPGSKHLEFSALDVIPRNNLDRNRLHNKLETVWKSHGSQLNMGLGLYGGTRFHIDTGGHRRWRG